SALNRLKSGNEGGLLCPDWKSACSEAGARLPFDFHPDLHHFRSGVQNRAAGGGRRAWRRTAVHGRSDQLDAVANSNDGVGNHRAHRGSGAGFSYHCSKCRRQWRSRGASPVPVAPHLLSAEFCGAHARNAFIRQASERSELATYSRVISAKAMPGNSVKRLFCATRTLSEGAAVSQRPLTS